ncbi:DUF5130 family protein [Nocardioides sp. zg-578]|uniref:DUF5130 family protein n=1 Tax=Nocardioides marmotae TaxID=2663857 RepID=A0A6I3JFP8_9ACTN|nr:DUF5130 family protein [Nocardioides marmotae]MCR6033416.1 DUF5130 family protein [Gordonia jinghuaiqii]MBC9734718.1 DUF5130 family protein [Nocardioides marmotae]MTB85820.1 DUF5130 family protein [Nocardioides marmotae]MTB97074.1 DUF5130 family protein [Nocardioides marmotae]QKE00731.1 DUF5130 family protein [Nocardioides marmotae]
MPGGEHLTEAERARLDEAIRAAERLSRVEFSVFIGTAEGDPRSFATQLHNSLVAPSRSILVMVDPVARALEIVTGGWVRRTLTDRQVELAALQMRSAFAADDLVGGLVRGIHMLAEHARPPQTLHAGEA